MSIKVSDLISGTCDGQRVDQWFKLLEETQGREHNVTIISNEEAAEKVSIKHRSFYGVNHFVTFYLILK